MVHSKIIFFILQDGCVCIRIYIYISYHWQGKASGLHETPPISPSRQKLKEVADWLEEFVLPYGSLRGTSPISLSIEELSVEELKHVADYLEELVTIMSCRKAPSAVCARRSQPSTAVCGGWSADPGADCLRS